MELELIRAELDDRILDRDKKDKPRMKKTAINPGKFMMVIFMATVLLMACNSQSPAAPGTPQTPVPTTIAPASPVTPKIPPTMTRAAETSSPTPNPILQRNDYLLSVDELPVELYKSYAIVFLAPDGNITYSTTFFSSGTGHIDNSITISPQPYLKIPDDAISGNDLIADPLLGENSVAYKNNGWLTYVFYKGNALVSLRGNLSETEIAKRGELTLEEMVNLGKVIDARLPNEIPLSPITFPEQLDQATYDQYLKSLTLSKPDQGSGDLVPSDTFSKTDQICLAIEFINPPQQRALAIYDVQGKEYIQKFIPEHSSNCMFLFNTHAGQYEVRFAINDTLVAILPFVVQ